LQKWQTIFPVFLAYFVSFFCFLFPCSLNFFFSVKGGQGLVFSLLLPFL